MKKTLKIIGIVIGLLLVFLIAAPFLFEDKILNIVKQTINKNIDAEFDFADADISFIRSFPELSVAVNDMHIVNTGAFSGQTLVSAKAANITVPLNQLFKDEGEPYTVNAFSIDGAVLNILVDKNGNVNYDIAKKGEVEAPKQNNTETSEIALSIQHYEITNTQIKYLDEQGGIHVELNDFNHSGTGDLSAIVSELDTKTSGKLSLDMGGTNYLKNTPIKLDAKLGVDLEQNTYTFLENTALINQLELVFDGVVKVNEGSQDINLTFKTPSTDFKNFLALIPEAYSKEIDQVQTTGDFAVDGQINGTLDETHIPKFNIGITSNNASFKYPDLPESVSQITIDTKIANNTGVKEDTYVNINALSFKIAQDVFNANASIKELMGNPLVNANLKGRINLSKLSQAYPFSVEQQLQGILDADIHTAFDMKSVEEGRYQDTRNKGSLKLSNFEINSEEQIHPIQISKADLSFNSEDVGLNAFEAKTGSTDLSATGTIKNVLGYMFNNEVLKGDFKLNSKTFAVNDFMTKAISDDNSEAKTDTPRDLETEKSKQATGAEHIKIPAFLDATIVANAQQVIYDDLILEQASGILVIKDETVKISNFKSNIFDGQIGLDGMVATKSETPTFNFKLNMNQLDMAKSFKGLDMLKAIAPIAQAFQGVLNSKFEFNGDLNSDFTPNLNTISGTALAEVLVNDVTPEENQVLSSLVDRLTFLNFKEGETKTIKTTLSFSDGQVHVPPFNLKFDDIAVQVSGRHGFDQSIDYRATFDVPAKYLGKEAQKLLTKLDDTEAQNITVPVTADIGGRVNSPSISTDLNATVSALSNKIVDMQKDKLLNEGANKVTEALNSFLKGSDEKDGDKTTDSNKSKDSVSQDRIKKAADNLLNGLFKSRKESE
ncbi:AsmA family protein [Formosa haliotis]|uniref:AsmA family protein n=1 Tax=Formosa haliotis TaxID=1555194 RepID=UPI0008241A8D|nr:AsmA family protein [Formosa haliotis]